MIQTLTEHYAAVNVPLADRYRRGDLRFEESDLIYSATERCECGAGLARVNGRDCTLRFWHCSRCLLQGMNAADHMQHDDLKPFHRWDIKDEGPVPEAGLGDSLSALYLSTRPNAKFTVYTIFAFGSAQVNTADEAVAKAELFRVASQHGTVHQITREYVRNG